MEVTKPGIQAKTWRKEVKCPRCECHLKISWKDIFILTTRKATFLSYEHILHYYIKCPECGHSMELNEKQIPYVIKEKVYNNMDIVDRLLNFYFS